MRKPTILLVLAMLACEPQLTKTSAGVELVDGQYSSTTHPIIGGHEADPDDWPWYVSLGVSTFWDYKHYCGGSLVGPQTVLTAAHCAYSEAVAVISGSSYDVVSWSIHPGYQDSVFGVADIALAYLDREVEGPYAELNSDPGVPYEREDLTAIGRGYREDYETSPVLMEVDIGEVPVERCREYYLAPVPEDNLCAGYRGRAICSGDSGGALVSWQARNFGGSTTWDPVIVGTASWGTGNCTGAPMVFVRVADYVEWLRSRLL